MVETVAVSAITFETRKQAFKLFMDDLPHWKVLSGEVARIFVLPKPLHGCNARVKFFAHGDVSLCLPSLAVCLVPDSSEQDFENARRFVVEATNDYTRAEDEAMAAGSIVDS